MKKELLLFGCMLLCSSFASADDGKIRTDTFPPLNPHVKNSTYESMQQRVLNDDKDKGVSMWATTMTDRSDGPGFVHFYSSFPNVLEKTGLIKSKEEDSNRRWTMVGGCMHKGDYYGYIFYRYDLGFNYAECFAKVDLEKGTWEELRDMSDLEGNWDYMEGMASDPKTGKLMGIPRKTDGTVGSTIGEVDPATGIYTKLYDLDYYYFSMAYDINGTLWAVRWVPDPDGQTVMGSCLVTLDPNNSYKETVKAQLTMGGQPFKMYYQNSMQFDYTTGDLYILAASADNGSQYVCKVDTSTGVMESYGRLGWGDVASGLYIPYYTADAPDAAFRVSNLTSTFDENGVVTLKWTNPTTTWDKQELTELAEVMIYRDGLEDANLVETLPGEDKVGQEMSWRDDTAEQGIHTYYVVPCRRAGEKGIPDSWRAFSGRDVPGVPLDINLVKDGESLVLTWSKPELGKNDGWYDESSLKYTITRYPDEKVVAENYKQTTFTDNELEEIQNYYYEIKPVTSDGEGEVGVSPKVLAGKAVQVPYSTDFTSEVDANQWTVLDANQDGVMFTYSSFPITGFVLDMYESANDDYAISPAFSLKGGTSYRIVYNIYIAKCITELTPDLYHDFRFTVGNSITAESQTVELDKREHYSTSEYYQTIPFEMSFTPETDGEYNFAFNYTTPTPITDIVRVAGFSIEESYDKDLSALSFDGILNVVKGAESEFKVDVKNSGTEAVDNYQVQLVRLDGENKVVIGSTEVTEKLEPLATTVVSVSAVPDVEGEFQMAALVVLEGDKNSLNDMTEPKTLTASPEGTKAFNCTLTGDNPGINTSFPISFYELYSVGQSIFYPEEFNVTDPVTIYRIALGYDRNEYDEDRNDIIFDASVYLGVTDKENIQSPSDYIPLTSLTKVFEGKNSIVEGKEQMMIFDLDQPFEYDLSKNLVFTIVKEDVNTGRFPADFRIYNDGWGIPESEYRSFRYENSVSPEPLAGDGEALNWVPVLYLAVETATGINNVVIGGNAIMFDGNSISVKGVDAVSMMICDLMGRTLLNENLSEGQTSVGVNLSNGVYIVKVVDCDGKVYTKKIRVS